MIEAYRLVHTDGYVGYWHTWTPFIDLMVALAAETDTVALETRTFADDEELLHANNQHAS